MSRRIALAGVLGVACAISGCSRSTQLSRDELVERSIEVLVDGGVDPDAASCVIERFFGSMTDEQLASFNLEGDSLSPSEAERIEQLIDACGATG